MNKIMKWVKKLIQGNIDIYLNDLTVSDEEHPVHPVLKLMACRDQLMSEIFMTLGTKRCPNVTIHIPLDFYNFVSPILVDYNNKFLWNNFTYNFEIKVLK